MSINGLSFASARPAPQPCVSVHQCGVSDNIFFSLIVTLFLMCRRLSCSTLSRLSGCCDKNNKETHLLYVDFEMFFFNVFTDLPILILNSILEVLNFKHFNTDQNAPVIWKPCPHPGHGGGKAGIITSYSPVCVSLGGGVNTHFHFFVAWFSDSSKLSGEGSEQTT